jgi:hypothetical protein
MLFHQTLSQLAAKLAWRVFAPFVTCHWLLGSQ